MLKIYILCLSTVFRKQAIIVGTVANSNNKIKEKKENGKGKVGSKLKLNIFQKLSSI